jgi:hypothetical protein
MNILFYLAIIPMIVIIVREAILFFRKDWSKETKFGKRLYVIGNGFNLGLPILLIYLISNIGEDVAQYKIEVVILMFLLLMLISFYLFTDLFYNIKGTKINLLLLFLSLIFVVGYYPNERFLIFSYSINFVIMIALDVNKK